MHEGELFRPARPWGRWLLAGAAVLTGAGVLLYALGGDDPGRLAVDAPSPSPSVTVSELPSPSDSPTPSPSALTTSAAPVTPSPAASATATATRSRRPRPTPTRSPAERPDGVPGWTMGTASCTQARPTGASVAPAAGLTIELSLPTNSFRTGSTILGTVRVTNTGTQRATFSTTDAGDDGTLLDAGRPVSAVYGQRPVTVSWTVEPGATQTRQVTIQAERCGDTSTSRGEPLPADRAYEAVVTLVHSRGRWSAPPRSVTLFR